MRTNDLIDLLARDAAPVKGAGLPARIALFSVIGAAGALVILVPWIGLRPDLAEAVTGSVFWMKAVYTFGLSVAGFALVERLSRPGAKGRKGWLILLAWMTLAIAFAGWRLAQEVPEQMHAAVMGSSWSTCPWRILVLSLPGIGALLLAMRRYAPTRPILAGASAGLLAGGVAATVYGLHCPETAAPFVTLWYSLGVVFSTAAGAVLGARLLRW